ncbi:hypothetical protein LTR53_012957 [Teratosphaeriaceae sp. CCFEE 6253]|nr:hypothetical protein LTR53_012957 [Teratosphaeriaceae sp. CCFEE 6253]
MKLASSLILGALGWTAHTASASSAGRVYICDGGSTVPSTERTLSPNEARVVLAQRAGVEDYHSADMRDEAVVEAVNAFGRRTAMWEAAAGSGKHAFALVDDGADMEDLLQLCRRTFAISPAPDAASSRSLWVDLARQASPATYRSTFTDDEVVAVLNHSLWSDDGSKLFRIADHAAGRLTELEEVRRGSLDSVTLYFAGSAAEVQTGAAWGTYEMPAPQSALHKRTARDRPQAEAPLEAEVSSSFLPVGSSASSSSPLKSYADNSTALPGILPACFTTQSACESTTRSCMGHGTCAKKYTDQSASPKSSFRDCYACICSPTKFTASDGKVTTTYWGGPACQKRDVSVQFWMLALFTVGLVGLVSFAVGELVAMGGQELPSVIGAGVSGPVRRS